VLAECLGLRAAALELVAGERARNKQVRIDAPFEDVRARVEALLERTRRAAERAEKRHG